MSGLEGAKVFNPKDFISGFFQRVIDPDSTPSTAVYDVRELRVDVLSNGVASSPRWFHSIMLRICEGLEQCKLINDDIVIL